MARALQRVSPFHPEPTLKCGQKFIYFFNRTFFSILGRAYAYRTDF
ncbi:hypothetical protein AC062_0549 [Pasteurellaceae bacterium NI1060]|nr:hypothetical protein AC062_0549 [Pasteurellaceae bacterium NI1060]